MHHRNNALYCNENYNITDARVGQYDTHYFVVCVAITRRCYMNGMSRQQLCFADATLTTDEHPWMSINPLYLTHIYWNNIEYGTCIYHATLCDLAR